MPFSSPALSGDVVNTIFVFFLAVCVLLLLLITALVLIFVVKYHRKKHPRAEQIEGNLLLEVIWTAVPTLIVLCMFYWGWVGYKYMLKAPKDAMVVKVTAGRWFWSFAYSNGKQSGDLYVPVGKPVKLVMGSQDVLHSLFIPAFRVKQDLVPGMETTLWFEASRPGTFDILCAEYCGQRHSYMASHVIAMPETDFNAWFGRPDEESGGLKLIKVKGCASCHSLDGTPKVGPSLKGLLGATVVVIEGGAERALTIDEAYLRRSILEPGAEIVKGFPNSMPPQRALVSDAELQEIVDYLKALK